MRILLLEDEPEMARALLEALRRRDVLADHVRTISDAEALARDGSYDVLVLDRRLPDGEGLNLVASLRRSRHSVPILVLTALGSVDHRVDGLDAGADDYLAKPFAIEELLARLRALHRRGSSLSDKYAHFGNLSIDPRSNEVSIAGSIIELRRREYLVLEALMRRPNRIVTRANLIEAVYTLDDEIESNALDAHISRIRKKLAQAEASVEIRAVRNIGYLVRLKT
ncbi:MULTISPECIES: response regulator transcription factor [Agrobacterium]|uniref:Response regulator transcription factor n=1 Tax=Agrobacterium salinitolerans TaxID=1183413 RepID=A0ABY3BLA8_9HYPH|nr:MULTISPECIES: response regulator transcription factor [Agrobacterium]MCZ7851689.1 response regulator transcription factor [Agrobacterium salinitolerans]MCZ7887737.1 response regulator transcription factor [Agrobacterium salinitolerans]MCZ7893760.1 response regulator transcription factor [Agrobacterium salinitolerans]MCZ7976447.1 response regulator transcription factor [Agrobacterium salinitolerans]MDA5629640.1 response regulator transcription factor [Agrobacterium sp. ST15.16.055]